MKITVIVCASLLLFGGMGCSDLGTEPAVEIPNVPPPEPTVSFANDLQPIFAANCVGCHNLPTPGGGLVLKAGGSWANLVDKVSVGFNPAVRVIPGNPDDSVLYGKLIGDASVGEVMPPNGSLAAGTLELFRTWILEGALDN